MPNPSPAQLVLLAFLNQPLLPELSPQLLETITRTYELARATDPDVTPIHFLHRLLEHGCIAVLDDALELRARQYLDFPLGEGLLHR